MQRIYIEKKRAAFNANTDSIAKILERSFNCQLRKEHLYMKINHEYSSTAFWKFIQSRPHGIKSIIFKIPYPNLGRISDTRRLLAEVNRSVNSDATLKLEAAKRGILSGVTPDNPYISGLVEASAQSGAIISVKGAGDKGYTKCGEKEHKNMDLPERISNLTQEDFSNGNLFNDTSDALASLLPKS